MKKSFKRHGLAIVNTYIYIKNKNNNNNNKKQKKQNKKGDGMDTNTKIKPDISMLKIDKKLIKEIGQTIADSMGEKIFHQLLLLRAIPEIQAIEKGKVKTITAKELKKLIKVKLAK